MVYGTAPARVYGESHFRECRSGTRLFCLILLFDPKGLGIDG